MRLAKGSRQSTERERGAHGDRTAYASQGQLIWRRFRKHKLADGRSGGLILLYFCAIFADFIAPYGRDDRFSDYSLASPSRIDLVNADGRLRAPFVYATNEELDTATYTYKSVEDLTKPLSIRIFVKTEPYQLLSIDPLGPKVVRCSGWGALPLRHRQAWQGHILPVLYADRISLSIGFAGVFLSFVLGVPIGAISG